MNENQSPSEKWTVCTCNVCSGRLEFEGANAGETIQCPHCGVDTLLFVPQVPIAPQPLRQYAILVTTGNEISGRTIEGYLGIARGIVVRSPNLEQQLFGGLKTMVGGNIESFAKVCEIARNEAFSRMIAHAKELRADAVVAFRYDATEFAPGTTEVLAYGTAVKLSAK